MDRSFFLKFLLALILGLVVVGVFDHLDVSALSAPFCLAVVLMGASLRQSPRLVVAISLVYILLVTYSAFYFFYHTNHPRLPFPYTVFGLVQTGGSFYCRLRVGHLYVLLSYDIGTVARRCAEHS